VRGDAAAAALWLESTRAPYDARRVLAFDAALALEAAGKRPEAMAAYELAMAPRYLESHALVAMIARQRLAALLIADGRQAEAALLVSAVDRVWARADAGLRDEVKRVK
jgi:hypothetical protein